MVSMFQNMGPGVISLAIEKAKANDPDAIRTLREACFDALVDLARYHLKGDNRSNLYASEDVAQSVLIALVGGLTDREGFARDLTDRQSLAKLLIDMIKKRSSKVLRHAQAQVRGGTIRDGDVTLETGDDLSATFVDDLDDPATAVEAADYVAWWIKESESRLKSVAKKDEDGQVLIVVFRDLLADVPIKTTAQQLGLYERDIDRKRRLIRNTLAPWLEGEFEGPAPHPGDAPPAKGDQEDIPS